MFRNILFFVLFSIGLSTEWGTSFSVRTPNDNSKPLDYEFSIKLEDSVKLTLTPPALFSLVVAVGH